MRSAHRHATGGRPRTSVLQGGAGRRALRSGPRPKPRSIVLCGRPAYLRRGTRPPRLGDKEAAIQRTFSVTALPLCPLLFPTGARWAERLFTSLLLPFLWACGRLGDRERFSFWFQWRGLQSRPTLRVRTPCP
jgi:hypothetical protein